MRYLFINSVYGVGSTGRLVADKCMELEKEGHVCAAAYGRACVDNGAAQLIKIGTKADFLFHATMTRIFDLTGFCSKRATRQLLSKIEKFNPDIIWLHNLHGYYLNVCDLFEWLKAHPNIKVLWTLHDCWSFTGHCAHYSAVKCDHWLNGCGDCPQLKEYPKTYGLDHTKTRYQRKKECFSGVADLTIIVPSEWLANQVKRSFLKEYPVEVWHNPIDTNIFKPTASNFRERYGLTEKIVVLGVANVWTEAKGLLDFFQLRKELDDRFAIVLVGATKKERHKFPLEIITLPQTSLKKLAEIYSAADVFVNPTHQDTYPTVNLEARACGTPVVTYDVGGSPESAGKKYVVKENNIDELVNQIYRIIANRY